MTLTIDLWFWNFESPYFIQDEHGGIHFKAHCYVTDVIVMIVIAFYLIGYQGNKFQALVEFHNYYTRFYMCINCDLGRFLKPIVKSNRGWQHGHTRAQYFRGFLILQK